MNIDSPIIIIRIFAGSSVLSNIILKSISGETALLSTTMNNESETIAIARDPITSWVEELSLPVYTYVNTSRNEVIVAANVNAPITSMVSLLGILL